MRRGNRIACSLLIVSFWLAAAVPAIHGEKQIDVRQELELLKQGRLTRHIPGASQRIAVFTFEDPDSTGLGDALAALIGRAILIESSFTSLGVLRYQGDLAPEAPGAPSYFDKVDQIVEAQNVSLAVWGRVRRSKESVLIDAYVQLPSNVVETYFAWSLQLPQKMGGKDLAVRLRPSRIVVQRLELSEASIPALVQAAAGMDALRAQPALEAPVSGRLPQGRTYSLQERRGDWVLLRLDDRLQGWAQRPSCPGECGAALSTGVFAGAMLRFIAHGVEPQTPESLTVEARAALDQMRAFKAMSRPSEVERSLAISARWTSAWRRGESQIAPARAGGATFANLHALGRLSQLLVGEYDSAMSRAAGARSTRDDTVWNSLAPDREAVGAIADELTEAALLYPGDPDVLNNLAVLFDYAGDPGRAQKARTLVETLRK
jgi:hypothetical protein